jgi:hypothetical protein
MSTLAPPIDFLRSDPKQADSVLSDLTKHKVMSPKAYCAQQADLMATTLRLRNVHYVFFFGYMSSLIAIGVLLYLSISSLLACFVFLSFMLSGFYLENEIAKKKNEIAKFNSRYRPLSPSELRELACDVKATGNAALSRSVADLFSQHNLLRVSERERIAPILQLHRERSAAEQFHQLISIFDHMVTTPDLAPS